MAGMKKARKKAKKNAPAMAMKPKNKKKVAGKKGAMKR